MKVDFPNGYITVGYVSPEYDEVDAPGLGVIVYESAATSQMGSLIDSLEVDGSSFPIVRRRVIHERALNIHAGRHRGVVACWVKGEDQGWLTARHVVEGAETWEVSFEEKESPPDFLCRAIHLAPGYLDAAMACPHRQNNHAVRIPVADLKLHQTVEFLTSGGDQIICDLVELPTNPSYLDSAYWPQPVTISEAGNRGDSGALLRDVNHAAIGIYVGRQLRVSKAGEMVPFGVGLSAYQIQNVMNVEFFE